MFTLTSIHKPGKIHRKIRDGKVRSKDDNKELKDWNS